MSAWLKAGVMAIGAACVLLLAGALPLGGVPGVYRGGAMYMVAAVAALLCLLAAWRLSRGRLAYFLLGLLFTFLSATGAAAVFYFGGQGVDNARIGGPMWFGAVGMFSLACVGLLFAGIFGFLAYRLMNRRLWLAALHASFALLVAGAAADYHGEVVVPLHVVAGSGREISEVEGMPLGFTLSVQDFAVSHYGEESYTLYGRRGTPERWEALGHPVRKGGELVLGERRWPVSSLRRAPEMPRPFLLAGTARNLELVMQDARPVRDYCATCQVDSVYRGRKESRNVEIRVNEPLAYRGWVIHLMSYRNMGDKTLVELTARRAPGRLFALAGMLGLIISTACWCWCKKEDVERGAA